MIVSQKMSRLFCGSRNWWIIELFLNSLTAIGFRESQLFNELRSTVVSRRIFIRLQSLITRWARNDFSLPAVCHDFYEAFLIDDVSRGSKSYLFRASWYRTIFADLWVVSVSRFWHAEFSFYVENILLFLCRYWVRTYQKVQVLFPPEQT